MEKGLETCDGNVSGKCVYKIYHSDENNTSDLFPKLTEKHLYYDTFDKMRVSYAVQIFSHSVSSGIKEMISNGFFEEEAEKKEAENSATFLSNMNDLFDLMNSKCHLDENVLKQGIGLDNIHLLYEFSEYLASVRTLGKAKVFWISGLLQTVNAVTQMCDEKFIKNANFRLFTRRLNQDALENFFGMVRAKGGNNRNPNLIEFLRTVSKLLQSALEIKILTSNCEREADSALQQINIETELSSTDLDIEESLFEEVFFQFRCNLMPFLRKTYSIPKRNTYTHTNTHKNKQKTKLAHKCRHKCHLNF